MWDINRSATEPCRIAYLNTKSCDQYPLHILKKMGELDKALREYGASGLEICGKRITIRDPGQEISFSPCNRDGPWKNVLATRMYGDKTVVISAMCVVIMLWKEGFIEQVTIDGTDIQIRRENNVLWETAWSIMLTIKEV